MALPRILSLAADGSLQMRVAPEANSLHKKGSVLPQQQKGSWQLSHVLEAIQIENLAGEIAWKINSSRCAITLEDRTGPWWSAKLEPRGAIAAALIVNGKSLEIPRQANSETEFDLFLDASVAELICDRQHVLTTRIYRKPDGPLRIHVSDNDLPVLTSFQAWQLRPISPDRLTA
jgi:hypothetical protein